MPNVKIHSSSVFRGGRILRTRPRNLPRGRLLTSVSATPSIRRATNTATRTATRTKVKKIHKRATPLPNRAGTDSVLKISLRAKGLFNKLSKKNPSINSYTINSGQVTTSTVGTQGVYNLGNINDISHLKSVVSNVAANSGMANGQHTTVFLMKSIHAEYAIQNSTNAVVRLQLWDFIARRDGYKDAAGNALAPNSAWGDGLADQGAITAVQVGTRPTDSKLLRDYFKVKRVTYTDLAPGQIHYHRITYNINRPLDYEIIYSDAGAKTLIKGWTLSTLMVQYGQPVGDNSGGVTVEASRCNVVAKFNYHFSFIDNSASYTTGTNNILTTSTGNLENIQAAASSVYAAVT